MRYVRPAARRLLALAFVYPVRCGALALAASLAFEAGLTLAGSVALATAGGVAACRGILRRSRRDPLDHKGAVKSLRLRRRVRRGWERAMREAGLERATRRGGVRRPRRARRIRLTPYGVVVRVDGGPTGTGADELRAKRAPIEAVLRASDSRATSLGPGRVRLELRHTDPLTARRVAVGALPAASRRGLLVTGVDEDGEPVERDPVLPSLIVGAQGAGKSTEAWTLINRAVRAGIPLRLRVFDPKIQEFADLADKAWRYENNALKWGEFLGSTISGMMRRQQALARDGIRNLTLDAASDRYPLDLMVVDELVTVLSVRGVKVPVEIPGAGRTELKADDAFLLYLSQARAALYGCLALSQIGTKDVVGPVRPLFTYATCLRVGPLEADMVDVMLGGGASKAYPAHKLEPTRTAGIGWRAGGKGGIVRYRAAMLSEAERRWTVEAVGRETARLREAAKRRQGETGEPPRLAVVDGTGTRRAPRRRGGKAS